MSDPDTITLTSWESGVRGRVLHDARSIYVERCWLPLLGPSTLLFLRFAVRAIEEDLDGPTVALADMARALGLSGRAGDGAPLRRTIQRAVDFHTVRRVDATTLAVHRHLPELSPRQLERAPITVQRAHAALSGGVARPNPTAAHALRLAQALAALGETPVEIERQLRKWHFSPATASVSAERAEPAAPTGAAAARRPTVPTGAVGITIGAALAGGESH